MESPYLYKLTVGSHIFRATTIEKEGRWYSLNLEDAYAYGTEITEYTTTKEFKLINITSLTFHYDFIDRLNIMFPGCDFDGMDDDKLKCLLPLGLLDLYSQRALIDLFGFEVNPNMEKWTPKHEFSNYILQGRNRLSDFKLDDHLSSVLEKIYGKHYDGIISPIKWPSKMYGGYFPRELHIFKRGFVKEEKQYTRPPQFGGKPQKYDPPIVTYNPELARQTRKLFEQKTDTFVFKPLWNPHTGEDYTNFNFIPFMPSKCSIDDPENSKQNVNTNIDDTNENQSNVITNPVKNTKTRKSRRSKSTNN
jgi:hypothetical protein